MARIPLIVQGVSDISASPEASLLLVTDKEEKYQLTIVVDANMRYNFAIRREKYSEVKEMRQHATDMLSTTLPETLSSIITYMTNMQLAVVIVGIHDGKYDTIIEDQVSGTVFAIRASDGVLLSYADPNVPLYIEDTLWEHQRTKYVGIHAKQISVPLNTLTAEMLREAMKKCIDEERYEMAEQLKKEMERRYLL